MVGIILVLILLIPVIIPILENTIGSFIFDTPEIISKDLANLISISAASTNDIRIKYDFPTWDYYDLKLEKRNINVSRTFEKQNQSSKTPILIDLRGYFQEVDSFQIEKKILDGSEEYYINNKLVGSLDEFTPKNPLVKGLSGLDTEFTESDGTKEMEMARDLGVTITRVAFNWDRIEPYAGTYRWGSPEYCGPNICSPLGPTDKVEMMNENGIQIVGMFVSTPSWASTNPTECSSNQLKCQLDRSKVNWFRQTVKFAVSRYPSIKYWEFWNEPEMYDHMKEPDNYKFWLNNFYEAVKEVDSTKIVAATTLGGKSFIEKLGGAKFDAVAYHVYNNDPGMPIKIDKIKELHSFTGKDIWLTEFGWSTGPGGRGSDVTQTEQADRLREALDWLSSKEAKDNGVQIALLFRFNDLPNYNVYYGIVEGYPDYKKKEAYDVFKEFG
jgi:hypothetical protein